MSGLLLDTTVAIDLMRRHPPTMGWVEAQRFDELFTSSITIGELTRGVHHRLSREPARRGTALEELRVRFIEPYGDRILTYDRRAAEIWGNIMGTGTARRRTPPADDAKIAAIALLHGLMVASSNVADLAPLVRVVDPRTGRMHGPDMKGDLP